MINPDDIFNAHRVVKSPLSFRRAGGGPLPILPTLRGVPAMTDGERRRAALRTVTASLGARVREARAVTVRAVLPRLRKR